MMTLCRDEGALNTCCIHTAWDDAKPCYYLHLFTLATPFTMQPLTLAFMRKISAKFHRMLNHKLQWTVCISIILCSSAFFVYKVWTRKISGSSSHANLNSHWHCFEETSSDFICMVLKMVKYSFWIASSTRWEAQWRCGFSFQFSWRRRSLALSSKSDRWLATSSKFLKKNKFKHLKFLNFNSENFKSVNSDLNFDASI